MTTKPARQYTDDSDCYQDWYTEYQMDREAEIREAAEDVV